MRTGLTQQEKTTEIYFDEKDPTIFIRTHNTDLKNRLTAPYREERRRAASEATKKRIKGF
jgi:hypothetical protein